MFQLCEVDFKYSINKNTIELFIFFRVVNVSIQSWIRTRQSGISISILWYGGLLIPELYTHVPMYIYVNVYLDYPVLKDIPYLLILHNTNDSNSEYESIQ